MSANESQNAWIERVLGYRFVRNPSLRTGPKPPSDHVPIHGCEIWRAAREKVNAEIGALCRYLSVMPDPELQRIATFGLNGATGRLSVGLSTVLNEVDAATADQQPVVRGKARRIVGEYHSFLKENPLVRLLDENPFGVAVSIRATLGTALSEIDRALAA